MNDLIYKIYNLYSRNSVNIGGTQQVSCLFLANHTHQDRNKSARIYQDTQLYHCFTCGITVNAIGLYQRLEDLSWREACKDLEEKFDLELLQDTDKNSKDIFNTYEQLISSIIIKKRLKTFNQLYYNLDRAIMNEDVNRLELLLQGVRDAKSKKES